MIAKQLNTIDQNTRLVEPNISRDSILGESWLNSELGRLTLQLMGNNEATIDEMLPTTVEKEAERIKDFIEGKDQLNWMIEHNGNVVGSIWVDLVDKPYLSSPSVHIMIGDSNMRGRGVGRSSALAVIDYLEEQGFKTIYTRYLLSNKGSEKLLNSLGFEIMGEPYSSDGLDFQNVSLKRDK